MRTLGLMVLAAAASFGTVYGIGKAPAIAHAAGIGCEIKGNVSYNSGARIYHVPGQYYYDETIINPLKGERWFCTEAEAQAAGWRRAGY